MRTFRLLVAALALGSLLAACDHNRPDPNTQHANTSSDPDSRRSMAR